jgi:adenosylcobinamide-phosphate synthase
MTASGASALTVIVVALLGDAILAGLPGLRQIFAAPAVGLAGLSRWLDARLNRPRRSLSNRRNRGAISVVFMLGMAAGLGYAVADLAAGIPPGWLRGWMVEAFFVATMLAQRRGFDTANEIRRALARDDLDAARAVLGRAAGHEFSRDDPHGVARGAIETCAMRFCDGVVAPVFWYLFLGLPGLFAFRAINVMARSLGDRSGAYGMTAVRLDRALNVLPAALCGLLISASAAFVPAAQPARAFRTMRDAARGRVARVAPWTVGAMAGALGLALGGPRPVSGDAFPDAGGAIPVAGGAGSADPVADSQPWIGDGRARAVPRDIGDAMAIYAVASMIVVAAILLLALYASG